jgi:hydrogenase expression/formation protein HypE
MTDSPDSFSLNCPLPHGHGDRILLAHGGGGTLMQRLIRDVFLDAFGESAGEHDAAVLHAEGKRLAFTTDSYVVQPLIFPGGDIGSLAVHGTVNDLAMAGARPLYLSAGFILEEGLETATLRRVVESMRAAAETAGVRIVTGDTKVVNRGKGDGIFINTSGVGVIEGDWTIHPSRVQPGDAILVSGDLGRHGIAIMSVREGLAFENPVESDSAALHVMVLDLLRTGVEIHCLRDLTRGGLASALNEVAQASATTIRVDEQAVPVNDAVRGACEVLGLDPLYVANEGRFMAILPAPQADDALEILAKHGADARVIGEVLDADKPLVTLRSAIGAERILDTLSGEQLPRIC